MLKKLTSNINAIKERYLEGMNIPHLSAYLKPIGQKAYKYALVIPVHEQKANWLMGFLNSYMLHHRFGSNFEIVLAVSNEHEFNLFNRMLTKLYPTVPYCLFNVEKYLMVDLGSMELVERYRNNTDLCIVNIKKFAAMHWASKQSYEYLMVKDCDSYFFRSGATPLFKRAIDNYNKKIYLGSNVLNGMGGEGFSQIIATCASGFRDDDYEQVKYFTKQFNIYPWFFDIPFYKTSELTGFFALMSRNFAGFDKWLNTMTWHHFEHLIFIFYRVIYGGAQLIDFSESGISGPPEALDLIGVLSLYQQYDYCPLWVSATRVLHQAEILAKLDNVSLLYHMDRF